MKHIKTYFLAALLTGAAISCMDDTLQYSEYHPGPDCGVQDGDKDMRLKVSVPRTYGKTGTGSLSREERIDTLDVLVFAPGPDGKMYLRASATGSEVKNDEGKTVANVFEVVMPLGRNMDVHVFANSHRELMRSGAFGNIGKEMQTVLGMVAHSRKYDLQKDDQLLPMHGSVTGVTVDKDSKDVLPVSVLRSVAKVSVMLNGKMDAGNDWLTGGELDEKEFELRELYAFYPADSGRVATADTTKFYTVIPDSGNVRTATLPAKLKAGNRPDTLSIIKTSKVTEIESIYLYENIPWTKDGYDYATTRMVVGGIYTDPRTHKTDKNADGTDRVSYYRINFQNVYDTATPVQYPVLRNHHYVFNITSVAAPGYDTPRQAAEGKPININVTVIDWKNEINNVEYDGQSYFDLSERIIRLPRNAGSERSIEVESNVDEALWGMYFKDTHNGATTPQTWYKDKLNTDSVAPTLETVLKNSRYEVTKSGTKITVKALKAYKDLPAAPAIETRDDVLIIKVKNLYISLFITQVDKSPDDWGGGGSGSSEVGGKGEEGNVDGVTENDREDGNGESGTPDTEVKFDNKTTK